MTKRLDNTDPRAILPAQYTRPGAPGKQAARPAMRPAQELLPAPEPPRWLAQAVLAPEPPAAQPILPPLAAPEAPKPTKAELAAYEALLQPPPTREQQIATVMRLTGADRATALRVLEALGL